MSPADGPEVRARKRQKGVNKEGDAEEGEQRIFDFRRGVLIGDEAPNIRFASPAFSGRRSQRGESRAARNRRVRAFSIGQTDRSSAFWSPGSLPLVGELWR